MKPALTHKLLQQGAAAVVLSIAAMVAGVLMATHGSRRLGSNALTVSSVATAATSAPVLPHVDNRRVGVLLRHPSYYDKRKEVDDLMPESVLIVDASRPPTLEVSWRKGWAFFTLETIPWNLEDLASRAETAWRSSGSHRAPYDGAFDQAVVLIGPTTSSEALREVAEAIRQPKRGYLEAGKEVVVPAFEVLVADAAALEFFPAYPEQTDRDPFPQLRSPVVQLGKPTAVWNDVDPKMVQELERERVRLVRCYKLGLQRNPKQHGEGQLRLLVDVRGRVGDVRITDTSNDFIDPGVAECVTSVLRAHVFPKPESRAYYVNLPIQFAPK